MKDKIKKLSVGVATGAVVLSSSAITALASEGDVSTAVISSLTNTAGDVTKTMNGIGPIALGVAGAFLVWRYGMKFFKAISK